MKYNKIRKILSIVLIGAMLCGTAVNAAGLEDEKINVVLPAPETENDAEKTGETGEAERAEDFTQTDNVTDEGNPPEAEPGNTAENGQLDDGQPAEDQKREETLPDENGEEVPEDETQENDLEPPEEEEEVLLPDEETQRLLEVYEQWLNNSKQRLAVGTYDAELKRFPSSYQKYLKALHKKHPDWIFVAVDTGLKWKDAVKEEASSNRSLIPVNSGSLLLSKAASDYNASKGTYIPKDGVSWVTASRPAVAYYLDPRNFLTDEYIFMFEALDYNKSYHTVAGVEEVLKGTGLSKKTVKYLNSKGQTITTDKTYGQLIYAAGASNKVSPLFLASKIRQETGGSLSNGSISGKFTYGGKSYKGYYNFYNIGAYSTSTGSAVANGLSYAKSGTSYGRPWNSPVKAINGGAQFLAKSYIARGQNTVYFQKFNTAVSPYYQNQYMQNISGAASEASSTYTSHKNMGIVDNPYVFYIPVYKSMPSQTNKISINKSVKKGKTTAAVNMRKGPSTKYANLVTIPKNATVTVDGGVFTDKELSVSAQQSNPYWFKVTYGGKTGYIAAAYLKMNSDKTIKIKGQLQLTVTGAGSGEVLYYETSNPAVATVSTAGKVTGVKKGTCMIYAVSGSGKTVDAIGITVGTSASGTATVPPDTTVPPKTALSTPKLVSATGSASSVKVKWKKVSAASGYYVYRKVSGGKWSKIGTIKNKNTVTYTDKTAKVGKTYYYTVRAYKGSVKSSYVKAGIKGKREQYLTYKTKDIINYRSGPGTSYAVKGLLWRNTDIKVVKGWKKKAGGYTWYKMYRNKKYYYVASKYLKRK